MNAPKGTLPTNLPLWDASNGSVVTLNYTGTLPTDVAGIKSNQLKLCAYPVPSNDLVTISYPELKEDGHAEIYNSLGVLVGTIPISSATTSKEINFSAYSVGIYHVYIQSKTALQSCKIIHN
jgi:hypothetical protein